MKQIKKFDEFINESFEIRNRQTYKSAVETMANLLYKQFVTEDYFKNAMDLNVCEDDDIILYINMINDEEITLDELNELESFSIKKMIEEHKKYCIKYVDSVDDFIDDNLDSLDEDEYDTVYDDVDAESIIHKHNYGGGGYEAKHDFRELCRKRMVELIKENFAK